VRERLNRALLGKNLQGGVRASVSQNLPFAFFHSSRGGMVSIVSIMVRPLGLGLVGVSCRLSQCSTILPFSKRKMSKPIFEPKKL